MTDGYFDVGFGVGSKIINGFDPFVYIERNPDDCWIGNFEGVASETTNKNGSAALQFRVNPRALAHIRHFDLYGVANNHSMQHGAEAYERTIDYLTSQGCRCFGSNAKKTQLLKHQGREVSITGFSQRVDAFSETPGYWHNPEYKEIEYELSNISNNVFKVVFAHWGNEFINRPSSQQRRFARWLVDLGFDLVIGMHPHVLQGYEVYHGKYIFYSLGNFIFDMPWEPTKYGAMVDVDLSEREIVPKIEYLRIHEDFSPRIIQEDGVPERFRFSYLNKLLVKEDNSEEYHAEIVHWYKQYRKANHRDIVRKMIAHPAIISSTVKDFIKRRI